MQCLYLIYIVLAFMQAEIKEERRLWRIFSVNTVDITEDHNKKEIIYDTVNEFSTKILVNKSDFFVMYIKVNSNNKNFEEMCMLIEKLVSSIIIICTE